MFSDSQLSHIADILLNIGTIVLASQVAPVLIGSELSVGHVLSGLTRCFGFWSFGRLISNSTVVICHAGVSMLPLGQAE